MENNQNNMAQNDYYNNDSYYSNNNNYSDHYSNSSYTEEKKNNGLWWKLLVLIILIVIIIILLLKFCGSGSKKGADAKYTELTNRICKAAQTYIGNNPTIMGVVEPGKSVVIKFRTLADANLIETQIENPNYDGNLFKKGTQERYYSLDNSVRVMVAGDGSYYCEIVNNANDVTAPELRLNGDEEITLAVGTDFEDPGYSATDDFDGDITDKVVRSGNVDPSKAGRYTLTYTVQDSAGNTTTKTRTIIYEEYGNIDITLGSPIDGVTPMIKLKGANPYCMVKGTQYVEPGAMATDNVDGNITDRIAVTNRVTGNLMGAFRLVYTVEDSSGNKAIAYRAVIVTTECPDEVAEPVKTVNNAPVITLVGKNSVTINKGTEYIDLGATAYDKEDGDLTSKITTDATQVNVNSAGIYKVIYRVTDSGGKTATKTRTVTVKDNVTGNPQVRFTEDKENITVVVGDGSDVLLTAPKAVNENGIQVNVSRRIEDYTTKEAAKAIDWDKTGKYRVIYTAVHGNGVLKQTKTIVVTIIDGETKIGGKDTIEVAVRTQNCDITEADLIKGGVTFTTPGKATPIITLTGHEDKACKVGTYKVDVAATIGEGPSVTKEITVNVVDKTGTEIPKNAPSKVVITDNSINPTNVYNTNEKWAGGAVTGITLVFKATPAANTEIGHFEYSKNCNTIDGKVSKLSSSTGSLTWTEEGKYNVCIRAVTKDNVAGPWSDPVKLYLDKTGPKVEFTHTWKDGVSDWHNSASLTIAYKATEEGSGLDHFEYTYDDVKAKKAENITTYNEANGSLTVSENTEPNRTQLYVYVRAVDKAGNKGEWTLKPAYANMDTVKPEAPVIDKVDGNKTAVVKITARAKDNTSTRPSGIGKFAYTLNEGNELSVVAKALNRITTSNSKSECVKSNQAGKAGVDYTQTEDGCTRKSDYNGVIALPSNNTNANVNYDVKVWSVDRAGNRSDGYASSSVTVAPGKSATGVEIKNGNDKITSGGSCSTSVVYPQGTFTLTATPIPADADDKTVTWTSSNASVAVIDTNGKVTAKAEGTSTITAKIGNVSATCVVTVKKQVITCAAGQYLPKGKDTCTSCLAGSYCTGGSYPISETTDQGISACPSGQTSNAGASSCYTPAGGSSSGGSSSGGSSSGGSSEPVVSTEVTCTCYDDSTGSVLSTQKAKNLVECNNKCISAHPSRIVTIKQPVCVGNYTTMELCEGKTNEGKYSCSQIVGGCYKRWTWVESKDQPKKPCYCGTWASNATWNVSSLGNMTQKECNNTSCAGTKQWATEPAAPKKCGAGTYYNLNESGGLCAACPNSEGVAAYSDGCIIASCRNGYQKINGGGLCRACGNSDAVAAYSSECNISSCRTGYVLKNNKCVKAGLCTCRVSRGSSSSTYYGVCQSNGSCNCNQGGYQISNKCV